MEQKKVLFGKLSLLAFFAAIPVGIGVTMQIMSGAEEMASIGGALGGIGIGLMVCIPSLIFSIIGVVRDEKPLWPALLGFWLSILPGGIGVFVLVKLLPILLFRKH